MVWPRLAQLVDSILAWYWVFFRFRYLLEARFAIFKWQVEWLRSLSEKGRFPNGPPLSKERAKWAEDDLESILGQERSFLLLCRKEMYGAQQVLLPALAKLSQLGHYISCCAMVNDNQEARGPDGEPMAITKEEALAVVRANEVFKDWAQVTFTNYKALRGKVDAVSAHVA